MCRAERCFISQSREMFGRVWSFLGDLVLCQDDVRGLVSAVEDWDRYSLDICAGKCQTALLVSATTDPPVNDAETIVRLCRLHAKTRVGSAEWDRTTMMSSLLRLD